MDPIASFIQGHDRFVISTHISPEGDAVGSALAVQLALERLAKRSQIVMRDPVPRNLEFLPGAKAILSAKQLNDDTYEQVILVDCATSKRVGPELYDRFKGRFLINIDHHCDNPRFGNLHHISDQASATMVVADLLKALQIPLDRDIATCLYAGLLADTNGFRNANVNAHVLVTAAQWVAAGISPHAIAENIFEFQSWSEFQLLAHALAAAKCQDGLIWCAISHEQLQRFDLQYYDTDGIVTQLRAVEGVQIALLFKEIEPTKVKVSLRAKGAQTVNHIAQHFGGGGHSKAAGCLVEGSLESVTKDVLAYARQHVSA